MRVSHLAGPVERILMSCTKLDFPRQRRYTRVRTRDHAKVTSWRIRLLASCRSTGISVLPGSPPQAVLTIEFPLRHDCQAV